METARRRSRARAGRGGRAGRAALLGQAGRHRRATRASVVLCAALLRGFWSRIAILLGLVFGYALSWVLDRIFGDITAVDGAGKMGTHPRVNVDGVRAADWFGFPHLHGPGFKTSAILVALPAVIALIAENTGHVKAVAAMTESNLDPYLGRALAADGVGTVLASAVGGSPTTTY